MKRILRRLIQGTLLLRPALLGQLLSDPFLLGQLLLCLVIQATPRMAGADVVVIPKFEHIQNKNSTLASREIAKIKVNYLGGPFGFYLEGFAEAENQGAQRDLRRVPNRAYLQEGYLEAKHENFYLRAGVQAQRWSEMWVTPSLDVWTGRRWNRFLFDPLAEQLTHPSGVLGSYAGEVYSADIFLVDHSGENIYPKPLPEQGEIIHRDDLYGGLRLKGSLGGVSYSVVGAQSEFQDSLGVSANYAFEKWIQKLEVGSVVKKNDPVFLAEKRRDTFVAIGADFFLDKWTLQPQATFFNFVAADSRGPKGQSLYYLGGTFTQNKFEFQMQGTWSPLTKDSFGSFLFVWNWNDTLTSALFVQNYAGDGTPLAKVYQDLSQGLIVGLRLEANFGTGF
jgi:hypothetical protein